MEIVVRRVPVGASTVEVEEPISDLTISALSTRGEAVLSAPPSRGCTVQTRTVLAQVEREASTPQFLREVQSVPRLFIEETMAQKEQPSTQAGPGRGLYPSHDVISNSELDVKRVPRGPTKTEPIIIEQIPVNPKPTRRKPCPPVALSMYQAHASGSPTERGMENETEECNYTIVATTAEPKRTPQIESSILEISTAVDESYKDTYSEPTYLDLKPGHISSYTTFSVADMSPVMRESQGNETAVQLRRVRMQASWEQPFNNEVAVSSSCLTTMVTTSYDVPINETMVTRSTLLTKELSDVDELSPNLVRSRGADSPDEDFLTVNAQVNVHRKTREDNGTFDFVHIPNSTATRMANTSKQPAEDRLPCFVLTFVEAER
ncbi:hypothetical protein GMRT_10745 [Giardia muris]|uniref:Uncharacterized protein n=1 Tax=Giardia muris TaxID=5742 RepID=A0A4Z1TBP3_GIAMU|nr:hypothetical protein GMRT_10745 [Giardia muris]|eukprot:TNJ30667.1 hypothetical protein GMRT_10745 [Giardia muris]